MLDFWTVKNNASVLLKSNIYISTVMQSKIIKVRDFVLWHEK